MVDDQDFSIVVGLMDDGVREWLVSTNSRLRTGIDCGRALTQTVTANWPKPFTWC